MRSRFVSRVQRVTGLHDVTRAISMNFVRRRWHATGQFDPFPGHLSGGDSTGHYFFMRAHAAFRLVFHVHVLCQSPMPLLPCPQK